MRLLEISDIFKPFGRQHHKFIYPSIIMVWLVIFLGFPVVAYADIGPKSSLEFTFDYKMKEVPIVDGQLINCADIECNTRIPPNWRFSEWRFFHCEDNTCFSNQSFNGDYYKLSIVFEDKTRESNIFERKAHQAKYLVTVEEDRLFVEEVSTWFDLIDPWFRIYILLFFMALIITLVVELIIAWIYAWKVKFPMKKRLLGWITVANLISLPILWLLLWFTGWSSILVLELFVVVFEAFFIYRANKNSGIKIGKALFLSFVLNLASFLIGMSYLPMMFY